MFPGVRDTRCAANDEMLTIVPMSGRVRYATASTLARPTGICLRHLSPRRGVVVVERCVEANAYADDDEVDLVANGLEQF